MTLLWIIGSLLIGLLIVFLSIGFFLSVPGYRGPKTTHFNGRRFLNPSGLEAKGFNAVFRYMRERETPQWKKNYEVYGRTTPLPDTPKEGVQLGFVNHSTFLIQTPDLQILTDPIWSERCSPFQWAGPRRQRPPGIAWHTLRDIDLVLLSHNHYDHFDLPTLRKLRDQFDPQFIVPLGLKRFMERKGFHKVTELDWWETTEFKSMEIQAVPANHFSSRGMFDRDRTLWCGYVLQSHNFKTYFLGDSGYSDIFQEIGKRLGPIDLALIPIGAYQPRWFMSPIHLSPPEALQVHQDIQSHQSVAMHFGTFPLANDGQGVAEAELREALANSSINPNKFIIPEEGLFYTFSHHSDDSASGKGAFFSAS
jgi:L-ascorbate metabolism protein UlaG (beta-lactamase superfamily)